MSSPVARTASRDDREPALEVWRAAQAQTGMRPNNARVEQVREKLAAPGALLAVVDGASGVLGMALGEIGRADDGAGAPEPGLLHLSMLVVHPKHRRAGIGSALLEQLTDLGWLRGYRQVSGWTAAPGAVAFLAAAGLEPSGRTQRLADGVDAQQLVAELAPPLRDVVVSTEGLRLGQLLKLAGLADTGSQARQLVQDGAVTVNDEVELRRGRQLADGDVVAVADGAVRIVAADGAATGPDDSPTPVAPDA